MAINLVETLKQNLGYNELTKIDPNTQEVKKPEANQSGRNFAQAAIPATLLALYRFGITEQGANTILRGNNSTDWLTTLFGDKKEEAVSKVSSYSDASAEQTSQGMENIAEEAIRLIRTQVPENSTFETVKGFINEQRTNILTHLPAELQMGYLLNDNTIDDRTHKMEGPMSNNMHFFEKLFSGSTTEKNEKTED